MLTLCVILRELASMLIARSHTAAALCDLCLKEALLKDQKVAHKKICAHEKRATSNHRKALICFSAELTL